MIDWKKYNRTFYQDPAATIFKENGWLEKIIGSLGLQGQHCLDFGCGSGHWISLFLAQEAVVTGVDASAEAVECCRDLYPTCQFFHLQTGLIPLPAASVDLVTVTWVLQEIYDHEVFELTLREICRVLNPAGRLLVVSNVYPDPGSRTLIEETAMGHIFSNEGSPPFIRLFPQNSMAGILERFGFRREIYSAAGWSFCEGYVVANQAQLVNGEREVQ